ncbi:MAG: methyltransferase domain-containing protein [Candidatus Dadabacteria bacterium]|nr:methyltransferase domain-containing protein [Candidatus Dadabacteria bacterium]NIQ15652.1 methyltransferase domain-containing protein [Candidatus Dadabacteria bacterium]
MCCNCNLVSIDQTKSDNFVEKMMTMLNHGALNLMCSIGYRTGLFDTMAELKPSKSLEIAKSANLDERYVREWLKAMFTGGIINYYPDDDTYHLPREHAAWLTRAASPNNIAVTTQWLSVLGHVEDQIVDCFKSGGGVPYEEFNRFNEVMADESNQTVVTPLVKDLLPLVPGIVEKLEKGINVMDLGCGSGKAVLEMAKNFPNSTFVGYDFLENVVEKANKVASELGLTNVEFKQVDAAKLDENKKYDLITTFDSIHDQADPDRVLSNIYRALKDDGTYFMQDIAGSSHVNNNLDHPLAPFLYTTSTMHCMTVSLAQGGKGLGTMWGKELACDMLAKAGFSQVEVKELEHDVINYYYIIQK